MPRVPRHPPRASTPDATAVLARLDLTPTAAKTYLALLDLGSASAYQLAERMGTYKANVGDALNRLSERGLVTRLQEGGRRVYAPTSPDKLLDIVAERERRLSADNRALEVDVAALLPSLMARTPVSGTHEGFEVYRGQRAFISMMNEIAKTHPKCWEGFGNLQVQGYFPTYFPRWFRAVSIRLFSNDAPFVRERLTHARRNGPVSIKWLPAELAMPVVWTVYGDNLLLLIYEPDIVALRIRSPAIVQTFRNQFAYLWKNASRLYPAPTPDKR